MRRRDPLLLRRLDLSWHCLSYHCSDPLSRLRVPYRPISRRRGRPADHGSAHRSEHSLHQTGRCGGRLYDLGTRLKGPLAPVFDAAAEDPLPQRTEPGGGLRQDDSPDRTSEDAVETCRAEGAYAASFPNPIRHSSSSPGFSNPLANPDPSAPQNPACDDPSNPACSELGP